MTIVKRIPRTASFLFDSFDFEGNLHKVFSTPTKLFIEMNGICYSFTEKELRNLSSKIADYVQTYTSQVSSDESGE